MFDPTRMSLHPPGALWFAITCPPSTKNGIFHDFHPTANFSTPPLKKNENPPLVIQNQIVLFKIKLSYSKSNHLIQNQIVLFKVKLCYSKSNCVMQNQIGLLLRLPVVRGGVINSLRSIFLGFFSVSEVGLPLMGDTAGTKLHEPI